MQLSLTAHCIVSLKYGASELLSPAVTPKQTARRRKLVTLTAIIASVRLKCKCESAAVPRRGAARRYGGLYNATRQTRESKSACARVSKPPTRFVEIMRWLTITQLILGLLAASSSAEWSWGGEKGDQTDAKPTEKAQLLEGEQLPEAQEKSLQANETVLDDIVDELISSKQGRSLGGFDDVYSDPTIKEALDAGDDLEARNLIKERLCTLGLMQCESEDIQEKRPYVSPDELIYAQPVDIKPIGKPIASIPIRGPPRAYGSPKPMPYPSRPNKYPPKRVGYGSNARPGFSEKYGQVSNSGFQFAQSSGVYNNVNGEAYVTRPPLHYGNEGPYAFENKPGIYNKPNNQALSSTKTESLVQQHVHHHYVHGDTEKEPKVIIKPVAIPVGSVGSLASVGSLSSASNSHHSTDIITAGGSIDSFEGLTSGGFKPMTGVYPYDSKPAYEADTIYGSQYGSTHNKFSTINTQSLPGPYANNAFVDQKYGNNLGAYSTNEFNKKELHIGSTSNLYNQGPATFSQGNIYNEKYHESRAQGLDCVCVNYDQCPSQEIIGRRDDLYLPIDPRNKNSEITALSDEQLDNITNSGTAEERKNAKIDHITNSTETDAPKKIAKRDVGAEKAEEKSKEIEPRLIGLAGYGGNGNGGNTNKQVQPTFGVSFGLPQPSHSGYPINPFDHNPIYNPYGPALNGGGLNLEYTTYNKHSGYPLPQDNDEYYDDNYDNYNNDALDFHNYQGDGFYDGSQGRSGNATGAKGNYANRYAYSRSLTLPNKNPEVTQGGFVRFPSNRKKREIKSETNVERQGYFGRPPHQQQQCRSHQVCCRRPLQPQASNRGQCGIRHSQGINGRIKTPAYVDGDSEFGEYPWQAAILKKDPKESVYVCGGTLIDHLHIMTAAHCVKTYKGLELRVRLGEWDVNHDVEFYPYIERDVISVHVHPHYYAGTLDNDLAILKLEHPVEWTKYPHISPACLPDKYTDYSGQRCWTTGWGKDAFGDFGKYQNILKEVDVPVLAHGQCQQQLRQTRLGYNYELNPGFICAGGEEGKDACKGDGGGPMVCERGGTWQLVGVVSWGIGCGQPGVPGVYVKVAHYLDWIAQVTGRFSNY
ncbi:Phenoloxidase-activating factor 2 [Eumeta japonica]|uniref:Phenoloxidase-activating factor 2 n=1 Tax=Eumeta variegata TaxID=151549 RepID=A0A4C1V8E6_EUMVA|nr:Phenoloxidase-activating factor 2 [Eumeta japonica]